MGSRNLRLKDFVTPAQDCCKVVSLTQRTPFTQEIFLILTYFKGCVDPSALVRSERFLSMKNPLTPAGIEPATFRFVAQHINYCATAVPSEELYSDFKARGLYGLKLPKQNLVLKCVFVGRAKMIKRQALVKLQTNNFSLNQIILIPQKLVTPLLLGLYFCMDNHVVIDSPKEMIVITADDEDSATEVALVNERVTLTAQ